MDDLFAIAHKHLAPAVYALMLFLLEIFLLAILLEEHKDVMRLRGMVGEVLGNDVDASA